MKTLKFLSLLALSSFAQFAKLEKPVIPQINYNLDAAVQCGSVLKYEDTLTHKVHAFGKILKTQDINIEHKKVALEIRHYSLKDYHKFLHSKQYIDSSYIVLKFATGDSTVVYSRHLIGYNFNGHMAIKDITMYSSMFRGSTIDFAEKWFSLDFDSQAKLWNNEFFLEFSYTFFKLSRRVDIGVNPTVYIQDNSARLLFSNCGVVEDHNNKTNHDLATLSETVINLFGGASERQKYHAAYKDLWAQEAKLPTKIGSTTSLNDIWMSYNNNPEKNPNLNCAFSFIPGINCTYEYWIR